MRAIRGDDRQLDSLEDRQQSEARLHVEIEPGVRADRLSSDLRSFDLNKIADALQPSRDRDFRYLGLQTIYDRYLTHIEGRRIETPQYFWMRVAMGLALAETENREDRAIEFYELLSSLRFTSATPTLFNSGTPHPQLSSCYLTTVQYDLDHIFKSVGDNARLSKWVGGLGIDWTNIRATGARINGTNGESQGVIPFLKIVNDVAVNQGGKHKGAVCAYLETWHLDFVEFLPLRKNTGDERRRTRLSFRSRRSRTVL
ncbi:Ribonucleoside-diphosphate reductase NrdZ [Roseimaritima multifibrata]|uniref:Ribonucleoside-diphosphate reductase n=1 Tax=Roseimaritima multifibrata TaxID=1930274 RepID=A0A517MIP4_9BACT|nr:ribonucleotide reductase N-terminal alpha domain-containing protein [Roseimaritima multifibrata]QDS94730.1 Ribonucleoside-diphosphate reductase NrdZ [Roseimaritima multifibrata]